MKTLALLGARRNTSAFTLLEVVLAGALFVLGVSTILSVFNFGSALTRTAELRAVGAEAVDAIARDLKENLFPLHADGSVGPPLEIENREVTGHPGLTYSVRTTPNSESLETLPGDREPLAVEWLVGIVCEWRSGGVKRSAEWTTIMLREVPFGARVRRTLLNQEGALLGQDGARPGEELVGSDSAELEPGNEAAERE